MKQKITRFLAAALLGGISVLWGCEKVTQSELSPVAMPAPQDVAAAAARAAVDPSLTSDQAAWLLFVDRVERGEIVDPLGQYVAKTTQHAEGIDATGLRSVQPKFDAAKLPRPGRNARLFVSGAVVTAADGPDDSSTAETGPDICEGCDTGTGVFYPPVTTTVTTSENQGGSGYIHDVKLINGANSPSRVRVLNNGYTMLDADLNKGAGGAYIYLAFQRDAANVLNGLEYYQGQPYSQPNDVLTNFQTQNGSLTNKPRANNYYFDLWLPNQNPYPYWDTQDLNAGAGGAYIYSYQSKTPSVITPGSSVTTLWPPFAEVAILSGNSSTINPPAGWTKYPHDLNEGAGGDYIYFCYR